jgi:uncharacterized protein (DUF433 family)
VWYERYVEVVAGVQGGEPVIAGTRTPVRAIAELWTEVYPENFQELRRALRHLDAIQLEAGLAYYGDHKDEIDRHIERHRKALNQATMA